MSTGDFPGMMRHQILAGIILVGRSGMNVRVSVGTLSGGRVDIIILYYIMINHMVSYDVSKSILCYITLIYYINCMIMSHSLYYYRTTTRRCRSRVRTAQQAVRHLQTCAYHIPKQKHTHIQYIYIYIHTYIHISTWIGVYTCIYIYICIYI